jgi:hypothetical protein
MEALMESIPALVEGGAAEAERQSLRRQEDLFLAEGEAPPPAPSLLPSGRGTIYLRHGGWERGLVRVTENWVVCAPERPTAAGVTCRCYHGAEVERVDFDGE